MNHQEFFARYRLDTKNDRLGSGAFGTVYKTYDRESNLWKAVKISEVKYIDNKMYSLISEFETIKRISHHKNIANYEAAYQIEAPNGLFDYVIMQYYDLGNLKQLLENNTLDLDQRKDIVHGLLNGIQFLHQNGIIHRDLKPSNILIARDIDGQYVPKITDFGLSKVVFSDASQFTSSFGGGTLEYSSPEQLYGQSIKPNTDLWAFGVISYEVMSGIKMFNAGNTNISPEAKRSIILKKIINGELPEISGSVPSPYDEMIKSCLVINNEERAQSATYLSSFLSDKSTPKFHNEETIIVSNEEKTAYGSVIKTNNIALLEQFKNRFPRSIYLLVINEKLESLYEEQHLIKKLELQKEREKLEEEAAAEKILRQNKEEADRLEKELAEKRAIEKAENQREIERQLELKKAAEAKAELEQRIKLEEAEKREKVAAALLIEEKAAADLREKELAEKKAAEEKENQREVERQIKAKKEKEEEVAKRELEQKGKLEEVDTREKAAAALLIEEKEKVAEIVRQNQLIALNEKDDTTYNEAFAKNKIGPLKSYLTIFPQGLHINEARIRIDELKRDKKPFPLWWVYGSVALIGILLLTWFGINHYKNKTEISTYEINGLYGYYFVDGDTITKAIFNSTEAFKDGKGVAFINDSMYTVEKDGTFIFTPRSVEVDNVKALTLETINEASLEKLYSLSNTFPNDPLISEVKKRIQELEKSSELNEFEKVKNSKEIKQLEAFLIKHPSSKYSKQIKDLIVELSKDLSNKGEQEFFDIAKSSNSKTLVIQYLQKYPKGKFTQEAKSLLDKITNEENRQIWDQARVNLSPDKISSFIKSNPNSPFIEDAKKLLQQLNKENQMQLERSAWEGARASNSLDQLNSFILKYPLSANVKDAKALIKNLESKSTEPIKPEPKKEETKEDNCAPILAAINQGYKSIPGGSYTLNGGDKKSVGGFALSQFEITQEQYKAVMGDKNPSSFKDQSDLPVESISYSQIREFLNKLNSLTCNDFRYRLPTVAEWEYAALGGKNDLMYAGSDDANEVAVYGKKKIGTQKVGTRKANGFGLYDMSGNVAELCSDKNGITRKGGSWNDSKAKIEIKAGVSMPAQSNDNQTGFRLVREKK